jgi:hypothetical protein
LVISNARWQPANVIHRKKTHDWNSMQLPVGGGAMLRTRGADSGECRWGVASLHMFGGIGSLEFVKLRCVVPKSRHLGREPSVQPVLAVIEDSCISTVCVCM